MLIQSPPVEQLSAFHDLYTEFFLLMFTFAALSFSVLDMDLSYFVVFFSYCIITTTFFSVNAACFKWFKS